MYHSLCTDNHGDVQVYAISKDFQGVGNPVYKYVPVDMNKHM